MYVPKCYEKKFEDFKEKYGRRTSRELLYRALESFEE